MMRVPLPVVERVTGVVLYEGPSLLDKGNVVVIATGLDEPSENEKTGEMIQVWLFSSKANPLDANRKGLDSAVCGNCKHRHFRSCYVNLARGPLQIYHNWKQGKYPKVPIGHAMSELFRDKYVRLGAYGDPAAVPVNVWHMVTRVCAGWTAYTHQWKTCDIAYRDYCMASADTIEEAKEAKRRGWRPFYVRQEGDALPKGFFECPASAEAGKRLTCQQCRVCSGGEHFGKKGLPSIVAHGSSWKRVYFHRGIRLMRNKKKFIGMFWKGKD